VQAACRMEGETAVTFLSAFPAPIVPDNKPVLEWIRTEFNLPASIAKLCKQHFLRVWNGSWVVSEVRDGVFQPQINGGWIVHWQSTPTVVKSATRVACSFREYDGKKYVVIKVWKGEQE
jgi:hypothetical protein